MACVTAAATLGFGVAGAGATTPGRLLLVVTTAPASNREVARIDDGSGRRKHLALAQSKGFAFTVGVDGRGFHGLGVYGIEAFWLRNGDILVATGFPDDQIVRLPSGQGPARPFVTLPSQEHLLAFTIVGK